jgi:hypothetical protein
MKAHGHVNAIFEGYVGVVKWNGEMRVQQFMTLRISLVSLWGAVCSIYY